MCVCLCAWVNINTINVYKHIYNYKYRAKKKRPGRRPWHAHNLANVMNHYRARQQCAHVPDIEERVCGCVRISRVEEWVGVFRVALSCHQRVRVGPHRFKSRARLMVCVRVRVCVCVCVFVYVHTYKYIYL